MSTSNSTSNATVNARMGLLGWLTLLFVVLKLNPGNHLSSSVEGWSWWLVLSPALLGLGIFLALLLFAGLAFGLAAIFDGNKTRRSRKAREQARINRTNSDFRKESWRT